MEYKYKDFSEITPYENNPRNNEPAIEAVAHSLQEFGWRQPVVIDKDGVIVAGHTRWIAAQRLLEKTGDEKWRMIPVHEATDLTEEQAAAYRLADNKTNELAVWDEMKLEGELAKIAESEIDMSLFGFDSAALDELFADTSEVVEDDYEEELPEEPKSKLGDITS
jgi:site-specific DNA-methyltransferase (adenine-specific)